MQLDIDITQLAGATRVEVAGAIDITTANALDARLREAELKGPGDVIVDLTQVSFIDSSGVAVLLDAVRRAADARRRLDLIAPAGGVAERTLALTGVAADLPLRHAER